MLFQGKLVLAPLGNVARDLGKAPQSSVAITQCGNVDAGPKTRSILAKTPGFGLGMALGRRHFEQAARYADGGLFRQVKPRKMGADDLVGAVALDPLGSLIPASDRARRIKHEDCIIRNPGDEKPEALFTL